MYIQNNYTTLVKEGQIFMKEFYELVSERLVEINMSKYKLAKLTGIFEQTVYFIVDGRTKNPRLDHVVRIASVLDIDLNELKGGEGDGEKRCKKKRIKR